MHDHTLEHPAAAGQVLIWALALTLGFAAFEALAGWWSGSLALLSDAGHMVTDSASLGLAALAAWLARKPPSARHSYGLGRAEIVAALVNAMFMLAVIVTITVVAVQRLRDPQPVAGETVTVVALLGLVVNLVVAWRLARGEQTMNTRGALLHVIGDLLGSIAALLSGVVIWFTGWMPIDPLLSLGICVLILASSLRLLREALHALMEGVPLHLSLDEIGAAMAGVAGVRSVHDLHIWTLSSNRIALSAHLVIDDLARWDGILHEVAHMLDERFDIEHVTLQPETTMRPLIRMPPGTDASK
ncbi:MAG: cation transporter [Betaproteobacteria bacterium]|nr:MAG: cation transporter [Betaproteobacteria bacterium]